MNQAIDQLTRILSYLEASIKSGLITPKEFQGAYLILRKCLLSASVPAEKLTAEEEKDLEKGRKIKEAIAKGESVLTGKVLVGTGEKKDPVQRVIKPENEKERLALRKRWSDGQDDTRRIDQSYRKPKPLHIPTLFGRTKPLRSGAKKKEPVYIEPKMECSFCKNPVDWYESTHGKESTVLMVDVIKHDDDGPYIDKQARVTTSDVLACASCASKIKPKLDKDGNYVESNIRWINPESL